jgi:hypothetical protein
VRVLEQIVAGNGKIEPLAMEAGFKSRHGFYSAFHRLVGVTPSEFRNLPRSKAEHTIELLKSHLLRSVGVRSSKRIMPPAFGPATGNCRGSGPPTRRI